MMEHTQDVKQLVWHPHEEVCTVSHITIRRIQLLTPDQILASASYDSHINLQWDDPDGDWCIFQKLHPKLRQTALHIPSPAVPSPAPTVQAVTGAESTTTDESAASTTTTEIKQTATTTPGAIASFNALAAALMPTTEEQAAVDHLQVPPLLEDETVWCLAFSPCGRYLASGGDLGGIRIWQRT